MRSRASLELALPESARIHLPTAWSVGTLLDRDMPVGERLVAGLNFFGTPWLAYPLLLIDLGAEGWLEVASRHELEAIGPDRGGGGLLEHITPLRPSATVARTAEGFHLTFEYEASHGVTRRSWPSLDAAIVHHHAWLRATYGLRSMRERVDAGELPAWVVDVPVVFTFDLLRPNGEAAHTYTHLRDVARDLHALGVPPGALFYLPGWCAPYDRGYPNYQPASDLGGRAAFREALAALHDAGYRAMVHTLAWGADPYDAGFDRLAHLAVAAESHHPRSRLCGPYVGWPGGAPARSIDMESGRQSVRSARPGPRGSAFETARLAQPCEATFTLGGLPKTRAAVIRITVNGRSLAAPAGWFGEHDHYRFPFPLRFEHGVNLIELEVLGAPGDAGGAGADPLDLSGAWYALDEAVQFTGAWTAPIAGMDADSPEWHAAYLERLAPAVEEHGIDAVHVDASFLWRWNEENFFGALRRRLPQTVFGTEGLTAAGMRLFTFGQGGRLPAQSPRGAWASKPSDLPWLLTREYMHVYQHLCGPRGFVPVGTSCSVRPVPSALPQGEAERWGAQLARSPEAHILYTMRLNYRDYGLDEGTRRFLVEHVVRR